MKHKNYSITLAGQTDLDDIRNLFRAYADELQVDLCFQNFEKELADLPGKYAQPEGCILIARDTEDHAVACAALRPMSQPGYCEMKCLYVQPDHRKSGLGRQLAEMMIDEGCARNYRAMRLDTLKRLRAAVTLYQTIGFEPVPAYYENPLPGVIYMEKPLRPLMA